MCFSMYDYIVFIVWIVILLVVMVDIFRGDGCL